MLRQYTCNRYKELRIGKSIKFENGFYETDDVELQELMEANDWFGVHIHFKDSIEEMERVGLERQEAVSGEKARKKAEFLKEMNAEERAEAKKAAKNDAEAQTAAEKQTGRKKLAAAEKVL